MHHPSFDFRNDLFPVVPAYAEQYKKLVQQGLEVMQESNVVLAGLCRNIAPTLPATTYRLRQTAGLFKSAAVVIFENDSTDDTRPWLEHWAKGSGLRVDVIGQDCGDPKNASIRCLKRATRMAKYRNMLRQHIVQEFDPAQVRHVILIDLDVQGGWSLAGLANTFGREGWDFMGSNGIIFKPNHPTLRGRPVYYDVWPTRWQGSDEPLKPRDVNPMHWPNGSPLVPINSCFGGMGIYRIEAFHRSSYAGTDTEHVPFHRGMRENGLGRLFMNPSQIVYYGEDKRGQIMPQVNRSVDGHAEAEAIWESFWKDIVCQDGVLNLQQLKLELLDFWNVMQHVPKVYMHITGGKVSKLLTDPGVVNNLADEHYQELNEAMNDELWPHLPPEDREL